jgi:hypothetical protein
MGKDIIIITACSRPGNLVKLKNSIKFRCTWIIIFDLEKGNIAEPFEEDWIIYGYRTSINRVGGYEQKNMALDITRDKKIKGYIYFLDDDNLVHPSFYGGIKPYLGGDELIYYDMQFRYDKIITAEQREERNLEQNMYIIRTDTVNLYNIRFKEKYSSDKIFFNDIKKVSLSPRYIKKVCCYFNRLKW